MEYTCVHSSSNQVVRCSDSMDVTSEVKVKLKDIEHIAYLILLQFSYISIHRRQVERDILIATLKRVRVEGEEIAQCSVWKWGKNFCKTEKCLPHIYVILQTSRTELPNTIFFLHKNHSLISENNMAQHICIAPPSPSFWPTHITCTTGFTHTLAKAPAAPTNTSELNSSQQPWVVLAIKLWLQRALHKLTTHTQYCRQALQTTYYTVTTLVIF